ncbi:MAG: glycosyltransferase family 4 protein [Rhodobacteraceae bacterium]|nr:glycosyltransferase family 4 protein [Paracoccaceae bacterium]
MNTPSFRTLFDIPCADVGVGMTCRSILRAGAIAGYAADLFTARAKATGDEPFLVHQTLPRLLERMPYRAVRGALDPLTHQTYLRAVKDGDIAYLWPSVPLRVYEDLARRGIPIVAETVNTPMSVAKPILDAAYEALGEAPAHEITDTRIADQEQRFALCNMIFVPNRLGETALAATAVASKVVGASFGTWRPARLEPRPPRDPGAPVRFLFVGTAGVRKGMHHLLDVWRGAPQGCELRIVGAMEPLIGRRFADVLNQPNISYAGYCSDVTSEYLSADALVLPSIEEGDPIATHEAAAHGLPVIASVAGAGRLGSETGTVDIVDPADRAAFHARITDYARSEELRRHQGAIARDASLDFDWSAVAPLRFACMAPLAPV